MDESLGVYVGWSARRNSFADGMPRAERTRRRRAGLFRRRVPGARNCPRLRERGHDVRPDGSLLSRPPLRGGPLVSRRTERKVPRAAREPEVRARRRCSTTATGCTGSTITRRRTPSISPRKPRRSWRCVPSCGESISAGLGEFVSCGCVLENRTLFEGIHAAAGRGSRGVFQNGSFERKASYFHPAEWEEQPSLEPEAYYQHLRDVFSRNLPRYFAGPEPIGMSLTGGLDSRMIMAWQTSLPGSLPCYTLRRDVP